MTTGRRAIVVMTLSGVCAVIGSATIEPNYRLLYNPTASAPKGWYLVVPLSTIRVDDYVVVRLPLRIATLASERGYLPSKVPLLKHVSAIGDQHACYRDGALHVDGHRMAPVRTTDGVGRELFPWLGCRHLSSEEVLLISVESDASFDGRYFGPVLKSDIIGRAIPISIR